MSETEKTAAPCMFPIIVGPSCAPAWIPWDLLAPHEAQASRNHYQTLRKLASRGGLYAAEAVAVLRDRPFVNMPDKEAWHEIFAIVVELSANLTIEMVIPAAPEDVSPPKLPPGSEGG